MPQPRRPAVLSQFLRDQRTKVLARLGRHPEPWMKSRELDIIVEALAALNPARCLEWGAGTSTLYFPPRIPGLASWTSVEHHAPWYQQVRTGGLDGRVSLVHIPPDRGEFPDVSREGSYEEFQTYVEYPGTLGGAFDFIFIDGRARAPCLNRAFHLVSPLGLVILHDANRDQYVEELPPFPHLLRLTDYRKRRGGILLASRGRPIEEFIDVALHQRLWRAHDRLAKWFFMR